MNTVRSLAKALYFLTRLLGLFFIITVVYGVLILLISSQTTPDWLPIEVGEGRFTIFYPFTKTPFLLGDYDSSFFLTYFPVFAFYGVFLWVLSGVFKAFQQTPLFTITNVKRLTLFFKMNIILPIVCLVSFSLFGEDVEDAVVISILHMIIGVFAFFMASIFKQGLVLQEEQDLTL